LGNINKNSKIRNCEKNGEFEINHYKKYEYFCENYCKNVEKYTLKGEQYAQSKGKIMINCC